MTEEGKREYLLERVVGGVIIGILWAITMGFLKPDSLFEFGGFNARKFLQNLVSAMIVFPLGQYLLGLWELRKKSRK